MDQLLLPLSTAPRFTFENIIVHEGIANAVTTVRSVYDSRERPLPHLFLYGPHGTGKTHILTAVAGLLQQSSDSPAQAVRFLSPSEDSPYFEDLARLASADEAAIYCINGLIIDDVHLVGQDDASHLWLLANRLTRSGAPLIMSSLHPSNEVFSNNQHLQSRVASGLVFGLELPDDCVRTLILDKIAKDRSVRLPQEVAHYLVTRKSRNIKELERFLAILDRESLRMKKRITLPFVKSLENSAFL